MTAKSVAGVRVAGGSSLVFIDPSSLRRSTTATAAVAAAAASQEPVTMATTASCLARAFGIVVRQIADLLTMLQDYHALAPALPRTLDISYQESINLQVCLNLFRQIFFASFCIIVDLLLMPFTYLVGYKRIEKFSRKSMITFIDK